MEKAKYPSAEISYMDNLFAIEYFKIHPEKIENGNPYNTSFCVRVVSHGFCGYASFEMDVKDFLKFAKEIEELYMFKRSTVELCDICYGSGILFSSDSKGHLEISGDIYGEAREQGLTFRFAADQTCLKEFVEQVNGYIQSFNYKFYCAYLNKYIEEGLCYDIQMISTGHILPSALPEIVVDKTKAAKICKQCRYYL